MMINKLALGTAQFGLDYGINNSTGKISPREACSILDYAQKAGITTIDTASGYGNSEQIIGEYIRSCKELPPFSVISKFNGVNKTTRILKKSLFDLGIDSLYGYLFHHFETYKARPEMLDELSDIKARGLVKKIGFSLYYPSELDFLINNHIDFDIIQIPFSIFDQRFNSYLPQLKRRQVEIHIRSVFLQGLVFKNPASLPPHLAEMESKLKRLHYFSKNSSIPISALALDFCVNNKFIDKVVIGVDRLANLKENFSDLSYSNKVSDIMSDLLALREDNEKLILPTNWKQT